VLHGHNSIVTGKWRRICVVQATVLFVLGRPVSQTYMGSLGSFDALRVPVGAMVGLTVAGFARTIGVALGRTSVGVAVATVTARASGVIPGNLGELGATLSGIGKGIK